MAHAARNTDDDSIQGINVTPLVDIMLVLIIIFMVASQIGKVLDLELHLPKAASAETAPPPTLTIEVLGHDRMKLDGRPVTLHELEVAVRRAAGSSKEAQALIAGDEKVPYDAVVAAVDAVRLGGITQLGLAVRGPDGAQP
jgi:biopolymer transport protein ExbD